jgi:large subunit ribosomal protein L21
VYAIVESSDKQYKVSKGDRFEVDLLDAKEGKEVKLNKVLLVSDKKEPNIGKPYIKGASVVCTVIGEIKNKKSISFRYRRRLGNSRKKIGHRAQYTVLKVKEIVV